MPPESAPSFFFLFSRRRTQRLVDRRRDEIAEHFRVVRVDDFRLDVDGLDFHLAGHGNGNRAAARGRRIRLGLELRGDFLHLLLHLLRLTGQLLQVGGSAAAHTLW